MAHSFQILTLRLRRTLLTTLVISILATCGAVLSYSRDWFGVAGQELEAYDTGLNFWTKDPNQPWAFWAKLPVPSKNVILVAIDDRTLQAMNRNDEYQRRFGSWPYKRTLWGHIISYFDKETTAKALVFDFLMSENKSDRGDIKEALEQSSIPVYVGLDFNPDGLKLPKVEAHNRLPVLAKDKPKNNLRTPTSPSDVGSPEKLKEAADALAFPVETKDFSLIELPIGESFDQNGKSLGMKKVWPNPPAEFFWKLLAGFGLVNTETQGGVDAKMRSTHFAYTDGTNSYVTLSVAVAADLLHAFSIQIQPGLLTIGTRSFQINQDGSAFIDYGGNIAQRFTSVSLFDVVREAMESEAAKEEGKPFTSTLAPLFAGKVIIIGGSAAGTSDLRSTPFENYAPGMVKHASEIDTFLGGKFIIDAPFWISIAVSLGIAFFSALVILVLQSPRLEVVWPILQFLIAYFGPGFFLVYFHYHVLSVLPSIAATLASIFATLYDLFWFSKKRDAFAEQFTPYLEESFVHILSELPTLPSLLEGYREVTLLSALAIKPKDDLTLFTKSINVYLHVLAPLFTKHQAYLLPENSQSITLLWGEPFSLPPHFQHHPNSTLLACQTALAFLQEIPLLEKTLDEQNLPILATGVGIWTGPLFLANLETKPHPRFTSIGDQTQYVKQLEQLNTFYGTQILIEEKTYFQVKDQVIVREVDWVRFTGSSTFTTIYELLGIKTGENITGHIEVGQQQNEKIQNQSALYEQALFLYRQTEFAEALSVLQLMEKPMDKTSQMLWNQCTMYVKQPPSLPFIGSLFGEESTIYEI